MNIPASAPFNLRADQKLATRVLRWVMSARGGITNGMRAIKAYRQATRRFYYMALEERVCDPYQRLVLALFQRHGVTDNLTEADKEALRMVVIWLNLRSQIDPELLALSGIRVGQKWIVRQKQGKRLAIRESSNDPLRLPLRARMTPSRQAWLQVRRLALEHGFEWRNQLPAMDYSPFDPQWFHSRTQGGAIIATNEDLAATKRQLTGSAVGWKHNIVNRTNTCGPYGIRAVGWPSKGRHKLRRSMLVQKLCVFRGRHLVLRFNGRDSNVVLPAGFYWSTVGSNPQPAIFKHRTLIFQPSHASDFDMTRITQAIKANALRRLITR